MGLWVNQIVLDGFEVFFLIKSFLLLFDQTAVSSVVIGFRIKGSSIFEFEDLLLNIGSLIVFGIACVGLLEIEFVEVVSWFSQKLLLINKLNICCTTSSSLSSSR